MPSYALGGTEIDNCTRMSHDMTQATELGNCPGWGETWAVAGEGFSFWEAGKTPAGATSFCNTHVLQHGGRSPLPAGSQGSGLLALLDMLRIPLEIPLFLSLGAGAYGWQESVCENVL